MAALGLSQAEVSRRLGVSDSLVNRWISGERLPTTEMVPALAILLNVSADWLLGLTETEVSSVAEDGDHYAVEELTAARAEIDRLRGQLEEIAEALERGADHPTDNHRGRAAGRRP